MAAQPGAGGHEVAKGHVAPGGEEAYGYHKVMSIMHGLEPGGVQNAGAAFQNLSGTLESLREAVQAAGDQVASNKSWQGSAANAAMQHFQQLHDQVAQLAAQSQTAGGTLQWLGHDVMPQFKAIPNPTVASGLEQGISTAMHSTKEEFSDHQPPAIWDVVHKNSVHGNAAADSAAQDYLRTFNGHLATANAAMPSNLAAPYQRSANPWGNSSGGQTGSGGSNGSGTGSGTAGMPAAGSVGGGGSSGSSGAGVQGYASPSSANPFSAAKLSHSGTSPTPASGSLQGYSPPASGSGANPFASGSTAGAGGGSANPFSRMAMMPGGGSGVGSGGASGEAAPGEEGAVGEDALKAAKGTLPGEDGAAPGGGGAAEGAAGSEAAGSEAAGAAGAEGEGASGMPMGGMGGGGGSQDQERQRQAWMNEDQSIWGVPEENIGSVLE